VKIQNKNNNVLTVSALKWAWNDSHAFVALNDGTEHSDQTGGKNLQSASMQCSRPGVVKIALSDPQGVSEAFQGVYDM